ncbi:MAG: zf-TFIIB domain-containing protein [Planctomycetota bacterium]|jgi:Zn-finger nucleic acid-binding protein
MSEQTMTCPKCGEPMSKVSVEDLEVIRCDGCAGIWLDADVRTKFVASKRRSGFVDVGSLETGREQDQITDIKCPRDGTPMISRRHPDQKHIQYEQCSECGGAYFDAGELRDLASHSLGDLFKTLFRVT